MERASDTTQPYVQTRQTIIHYQCQFFRRRKWCEYVLLIISFINLTLFLGFTILDLVNVIENRNMAKEFTVDVVVNSNDLPAALIEDITDRQNNTSFTFDMAAFLTFGFVSVLLLYGLIAEKKYEIFISIIVMLITLCFLAADITDPDNWNHWNKKARLFSALSLTLLSIPFVIKVVSEDAWNEFRVAGTSTGMMDLYRRLKFFNALLHLDFFVVCLLALFNLSCGIGSSLTDYILVFILMVYGALSLIIGSIAVNKEVKRLVFVFLILAMVLPIWVPIQVGINSCFDKGATCRTGPLLLVFSTISAGALALVVRTYLIVELLKVYKNFGYGLIDRAFVGLVAGEASSLLARLS